MTKAYKIAGLFYLVNAIYCLIIGLAFVFGKTLFPFHLDVIGTAWQNLGAPEQALYLGMMRTEGAGFLATFTALAFLLYYPFRRKEIWACWAMTVIGIAEHLPTLLATYHVSQTTPASPPWLMTLVLILLLIAALLLALQSRKPANGNP